MKKILNRVCDNYEGLRLLEINDDDTGTYAKFEFTNLLGRECNIDLHPRGDSEAFYMIDNENRIRYDFVDCEGIPIIPNGLKVKEGEVVPFTIRFDMLNARSTHVDILEGEPIENEEYTNWYFRNVELK